MTYRKSTSLLTHSSFSINEGSRFVPTQRSSYRANNYSPSFSDDTNSMDWTDDSSNSPRINQHEQQPNEMRSQISPSFSAVKKSRHSIPCVTPPRNMSLCRRKASPSYLLSMLDISESSSYLTVAISQPPEPAGNSSDRFPLFRSTDNTSSISGCNRRKSFGCFNPIPDVLSMQRTLEEEPCDKASDNAGHRELQSIVPSNVNPIQSKDVCVEFEKKRRRYSHKQKVINLMFVLVLSFVLWSFDIAAVLKMSPMCNNEFDIIGLQQDLETGVYGQQLATETILNALKYFYSVPDNNIDNISKVIGRRNLLVLSFHGWIGIGKNHVSNKIANHLPVENVHKLIVPLHFPHSSREDDQNLRTWILSNITGASRRTCGPLLFIIDEVDKASKELINTLYDSLLTASRMLNYVDGMVTLEHGNEFRESSVVQNGITEKFARVVHSNEFHKSDVIKMQQTVASQREVLSNIHPNIKVIILLLSNTGGTAINALTASVLSGRKSRTDIKHEDVVIYLKHAVVDPWYKDMMYGNIINYIVPFLPLERQHVSQCVQDALRIRGKLTVDESKVNDILDQLDYFPRNTKMFSAAGCRKVPSVVDLVLD